MTSLWFGASFNHGLLDCDVINAGERLGVARRSADLSLPTMAVVPIRIVGDPVLHTATTPVPVGPDGSLPADLADLITDLYETMDAAIRSRLGRQPDRRARKRVFVYDCADATRPHRRGAAAWSSTRCWRPPRSPRPCPTPTTTTRAACRCPASSSRPAAPSGRGSRASTPTATPVTLEGNGLFARMLQHETGHLDGFLYVDRLVGRHARAAKRTVKRNGWGVPGLSWTARRGPRSVRSLSPVPELPPTGTRVSLRYRLPAGSAPPLTDVVGHLVAVGPILRVRTKRGDEVDVAAVDVVAVKALADAPVRTADIRNLEHAAAAAWPGASSSGSTAGCCASGRPHAPRQFRCAAAGRRRPARAARHRRLVHRPRTDAVALGARPAAAAAASAPTDVESLVMTRALPAGGHPAAIDMSPHPDDRWLHIYQRDVPVDVLTAVVDGEVTFGRLGDAAVGRAAVTSAPDGTRWLGMSAVQVVERPTSPRPRPDAVRGATRLGRSPGPPAPTSRWSSTTPAPSRCTSRWASSPSTGSATSTLARCDDGRS